ncbi:hypothetical protein SLEP1_g10783 [Rubroshorea leprosula]|uniref:Uncharacterized protein n=1 Tax=Rubroshorea leprosula TaxID=152421 RepID=A0AAV5IH34_9ROSI|nr:hypothetical protein SLEP1_g10783 [Rubroshorea leprosula]
MTEEKQGKKEVLQPRSSSKFKKALGGVFVNLRLQEGRN